MSWTGKKYQLLMAGALLLLYLLTMLLTLRTSAKKIQLELIRYASAQAGEMEDGAKAIAEDEDLDDRARTVAYQRLVCTQDQQTGAPYHFDSAALIMDRDKNTAYSSRNGLLLTFTGENGEKTVVPAVFEAENSAEVGEILWDTELSVGKGDYGGGNSPMVMVEGRWLDGLFYIVQIRAGIYGGVQTLYESPVSIDGSMETLVCSGLPKATGKYLSAEPLVKSFGRENYWETDYVSGWKRTDKLLEEFREWAWDLTSASKGTFQTANSLFETQINLYDWMWDWGTGQRVAVVYGASFNPMALAASAAMGDGTIVFLTLLFLLAEVLLGSYYAIVRKRELQGLQDKLARQTQALEYAKNAEESRREMTSAIAHELKTPVAVLSSYAEALQENIDAEKQSHYLEVLREETSKMDKMVMELLDLSRLEAGKYQLRRENLNLTELVKEIIKPLEEQISEKELELVWQIGEEEVNADRFRLGQVVENFMTNAIRHTPQGGKIVLRVGMNHETFSVENQGRPIPESQLSKVFETFWQGDQSRSGKGSGLGLAICRSVMTLHGGSCRVENTPAGVKFTANLGAAPVYYQGHRMPREEQAVLRYPISQQYTTIENVFRRLNLLEGVDLRRELKAGNIRVGTEAAAEPKQRLYSGYMVFWQDVTIQVVRDEDEKHYRLLYSELWGGGLGRPESGSPAAGTPRL